MSTMREITITKRDYRQLLKDSEKLSRLEAGGVDNWDWYGDCLYPRGDGNQGFDEFCEMIDREFADREE